jgi:hypothetical protein
VELSCEKEIQIEQFFSKWVLGPAPLIIESGMEASKESKPSEDCETRTTTTTAKTDM